MANLIFASEGNPVPDRMAAGRLAARDGTAIRWARFPAAARPLKGTVIIVPGRNECIEKYFETVRDLSKRGLGSLVFDLRGQGGSDRLLADTQRGHVRSFDDYVGDLEEIFEQIALPDCPGPYYMLAHSTGGLVALLAAPGLVNRVRRMVLTAPLIEFAGLPVSMPWLRRITGLLYRLGLGARYFGGGPRKDAPEPFATNKLTTDHSRYERNVAIYRAHPQLALGGPTVAWIRAVCMAVDRLRDPDFLARIHIPLLIVAAGADEVVSTLAAERLRLDHHHRRRPPRIAAGGRPLPRAGAGGLRRLRAGQRRVGAGGGRGKPRPVPPLSRSARPAPPCAARRSPPPRCRRPSRPGPRRTG